MATSGENLLVVKPNVYYEINNAANFNVSYGYPAQYKHLGVNGEVLPLNQTMIINSPAWGHMYVASVDPDPTNYFGIAWTTQNGIINSWSPENYYDTDHIVNLPRCAMSFTQMENGTMVCIDTLGNCFYRHSATLADRWEEGGTALPANGYYSAGHINNRIIAIDTKGANGAYYSDDLGTSWNSISGLPTGRPLLSISSPYEQVCLVGTDSAGVYVLNEGTGSFQPANSGLPPYTVVRGIAFKENIYKNDTKQQYVYLATNTGIYQSVDMGLNWVKTIPGNFVAVY